MFRIQNTARSLAAIAALVLIAAAPPADPQGRGGGRGGGGGGGGGGTGGGTIYFIAPFENATGFGTAQMTTMNSDGSDKTRLARGLFGNVSTEQHNGHRWFITTKNIAGSYYPDGGPRREVVAFRDDFHGSLNNNVTTKVQLTDNITLEPVTGTSDWVPGGQLISFKGRQWSGAAVVEGGLYTASLEFGSDGNIIGLVAQPTAPAIPFPLGVNSSGLYPIFRKYCWDPGGDRIAYVSWGSELWMADLANAHTLIYSGLAHAPQWSPDGSKIAYEHVGIWTIKTNGKGRKRIVSHNSNWTFHHPYWSPTGSHLVFTGQAQSGWPPNMDVFTANSRGDNLTNLTNTADPLAEFINHSYGGGWK